MKGWRTLIFNIIMMFLMIYKQWNPEAFAGLGIDETDVNSFLDALDYVIAVIWGAGNFILRWITSTKIFQKG